MGIVLSKKNSSKQKTQQKKQQLRQAKKNRQKHDPLKWEEKKEKKKAAQQKKWDAQYSKIHPNCPLPLSIFPSPQRCRGCTLPCKYNPN